MDVRNGCSTNERVYGSLLADCNVDSAVVLALKKTEETRAIRLEQLLRDPSIIRGLDSLMVHFFRVQIGTTSPALAKAMEISVGEVTRAVEAALADDFSAMSNSCRLITELTVLIEEWSFTPTRMQDWLTADKKRRSELFGFGNLLDRVSRHQGIDGDHVRWEKAHHLLHSQQLHPSPEEQAAMIPDIWAGIDEIVGHVDRLMHRVNELLGLQAENVGAVPGYEIGTTPIAWQEVVRARAARQAQFEAKARARGFVVNKDPLLPKSWTYGDIVRRLDAAQD